MVRVALERPAAGVRVLRLMHPEHRNAIDREMRDAMIAATAAVESDIGARVLVVVGSGTAFCSGADLPDVLGSPGRPISEVRGALLCVYESFLGIRRLAIPTVAAVHGAAVGAGVNLALSCDFRIFGPNGSLDISFARLGLHPGGGCTAFLVAALGRQRALDTIMCARRLDAAACLSLGLALEVAPDAERAALDLASALAALDPELSRGIKRTVDTAVLGDFDATLEAESWEQAASFARAPDVLATRRRPT